MNFSSKVFGGVKWTTAGTVIMALVAILKISILTRFLSKEDFGLVAIVTFVLTFMELFNDMGISTGILHKQKISQEEYSSLYWINLFFSVLLYIILCSITPLIVKFYHQEKLAEIIPILGLNLIFTGLGRQFRVIFQKELKFKFLALVDIFAALFSLLSALFFAINGLGVFALVYSTVIQFLISNLIFLFFNISKNKVKLYFRFSLVKDFLKIGVYQVGAQIANYFNRDLDILIIGKFFNPAILGGYSLAKQLVFRPFQLINPILVKVASPVLARFQNDINVLKSNYLKLLNLVSSLNILVYLCMIIFAPIIIKVLYGNDYSNIVVVTRLLCVYMIFRSIGNPVGSLVIATGRTDIDLTWNLITLIITPFSIWIGSYHGINGVAISLICSMILLYYPSWKFMISKMIPVGFTEYLKACFVIDIAHIKAKILK